MAYALRVLGGQLQDVLRLKVYLADWRDKEGCEQAYGEHFPAGKPCFSSVGSWGFPLPFAVVEAELTAVVGGASALRYHAASGGDAQGALDALADSLAASELGMRDVVSVNVTLADVRDYTALDEAFATAFARPYPARTISVAPLAEQGMRIGLEATALRGGGEPIEPSWIARLPGAASQAMLAGAHLFVGAQPGVDADGRIAGDVGAQTRAAWRRINAILEKAGMDASHVIRTNNWLTDWRCYGEFNAAYGEFVAPPYPPRATVAGGLSDRRALVQVEACAHRAGGEAIVLESSMEEERHA
jgi:enamine deaminase RidA (YjgF/YER057c/UK114 family)